MKAKVYCLITAVLVGFAVWFGTYQHFVSLRAENQTLEQKIFALQSERATLQDSVRHLKPYHEWRVKWLARGITSETDDPSEMKYVATVIRNRVETGFRNRYTFKGVILDENQFSAFNKGRDTRSLYMRLDDKIAYHRGILRWDKAKDVANEVILAHRSDLPLPISVLQFWSPVSMPEYKPRPLWASRELEYPVEEVEDHRFKFQVVERYKSNSSR